MSDFAVLIDGLSFTECPRWRDGRLYVSDRYTRRILAIAPDGTAETYAQTPGLPAGIGFLPDGRLLITSMHDRKVLRREHDGSVVEHADLSALATGELNDMLVDGNGRAWVGNFGFDLFSGAPSSSTVLISVAPDGTACVAASGLFFPNGAVLTPDGRTLIIAETFANRLTAFTVSGGSLTNRRTWAAFGDFPATIAKIAPEPKLRRRPRARSRGRNLEPEELREVDRLPPRKSNQEREEACKRVVRAKIRLHARREHHGSTSPRKSP